jgi:acyl-CoA thioester hydrolase
MAEPRSVWWQLRVRFQECDPQRVVFNAHYQAYADMNVFEFWRETMGTYDAVLDRGVDTVVVTSEARYFAPAHFDDLLDLEGFISHVGNTSFEFSTRIFRAGDLLTLVKLRYVFVDRETGAKKVPPDDIRELLLAHLHPAEEEA